MARITIVDCLKHIDSRFELVTTAARRARQLERGAESHLPWKEGDSPSVQALREISQGFLPAQQTPASELANTEEQELARLLQENDAEQPGTAEQSAG